MRGVLESRKRLGGAAVAERKKERKICGKTHNFIQSSFSIIFFYFSVSGSKFCWYMAR